MYAVAKKILLRLIEATMNKQQAILPQIYHKITPFPGTRDPLSLRAEGAEMKWFLISKHRTEKRNREFARDGKNGASKKEKKRALSETSTAGVHQMRLHHRHSFDDFLHLKTAIFVVQK